MQHWEYEIIKALDELMWCVDDDDDYPDDDLDLEFRINFQWIAWF